MEAARSQRASTDLKGHIRLACQGCQRKKIKCDRTFPCGQCVKSSLQCVPSTRKPRARNVERRTNNSELRKRISKLENLVESLSSTTLTQEHSASDLTEQSSHDADIVPLPVTEFVGTTFWSNLTREVQALRESLEEVESENEEEPTLPEAAADGSVVGEFDLIICPPSSIFVMPGALQEPSPAMAEELLQIYLVNVDAVFKVFHIPTLKSVLAGRPTFLGHPIQTPAIKALRTTLWFAAVNTLADEECLERFQISRTPLLSEYRRNADVAFAKADLINTSDILVMQAYVVFLVSARTSDSSRRVWTMTALIARIARANKLDHESPQHAPFEKEIRRRLWHQLRVLDAYVAVDRCTEPMVRAGSYETRSPSNVNDSEFDESSISVPNHAKGLTDMTYSLMVHAAASLTIHLMLPESTKGGETWQQRLDLTNELKRDLRDKYLQYCDPSIPFQRFTLASGGSMVATAAMRAVRPMQTHVSSVPPRVNSPSVLRVATNSIRESENIDAIPESRAWRWMFWVQWHALAVALAGLCSIRDTPLANEAWTYANRVYDRHSRRVADSKNGMLWRPIEKLYKKASAFRDQGTTSPSDSDLASEAVKTAPETLLVSEHEQIYRKAASTPRSEPQDQSYLPVETSYGLVQPGTDAGLVENFDSMNFDGVPGMTYSMPLQSVDMMWTDWERIMDDMSSNPNTMAMGENPFQMAQLADDGMEYYQSAYGMQ